MNILQMFEQAKINLEQGDYEQSVELLEQCIEADEENVDYYWYLGLVYLLQGEKEKAQSIYLSVFAHNGEEDLERLRDNLILILESCCLKYAQNSELDNVHCILDAIRLFKEEYQNPELDLAINHTLNDLYESGIRLAQEKNHKQAEFSFRKILSFINDDATWYNLGILYYKDKQLEEAQKAIENAINLDNLNPNYFYVLGLITEKQDKFNNSILAYRKTIELDETFLSAYNNLGNCLRKIKQFKEAEVIYKKAIEVAPSHCGAYINLGNLLLLQKKHSDAVTIYEQANQFVNYLTPEIFDGWIEVLKQLGKIEEAITVGEVGITLFPEDLFLFRKYHLLLPIIYKNTEEIDFFRMRFTEGLNKLSIKIDLDSLELMKEAMNFINGQEQSGQNNFYLAYQNKNDFELNQKYGNLVHKIMKANYPQWSQPLKIPLLKKQEKIRIGYISQRLQKLLGELYSGWIKHSDKKSFEIYSYDLGDTIALGKNDFQKYSSFYHRLPNNLEKICKQIKQDNLHILIFLDLGMDNLMTQLGALRLAPIQCTTWGHPMTSGLPTINYFLTSEAMESSLAQGHYSEKIVCLPNLGFCIKKPALSENDSIKSRLDFGLSANETIYLSCQHISKYLPQHDYIFPEIAKKIKNAKFLFVEGDEGQWIFQKFQLRLTEAFSQNSLQISDFCIFFPRLSLQDYFDLLYLSDIFLDTLGWSGGLTSLDAIACDLPIVTCPSELLRGRQSFGMLNIIGVTDTIAANESQYIEIAQQLAINQLWRAKIKDKMKTHKHLLFNDITCIKSLEIFYKESLSSNKI